MVDQLVMIQKLERVARYVETNQPESATALLDKMIYDLCKEVEQFEKEFMENVPI